MESNNLRTEKIITGSNISRDSDDLLSAVGVKRISAPVVGLDKTVLEDLEPFASSILGRIADLGEVDDDGTVMVSSDGLIGADTVTGLLVHFDGDGSTSRDGTNTGNTLVTTSITLNVLQLKKFISGC